MRLKILDRGHRLREKLLFRLIHLLSRREPPDVVKLLKYRPEYLGASLCEFFQKVMRGPSDWSVGERELFAAFVSRQNQCLF